MDIPASFSTNPGQSPHKYFLNLLIQFRKKILNTPNAEDLNQEMEALINASRDIPWNQEHDAVYKKNIAEKTLDKFFNEFKRFSLGLADGSQPNPQDVLDALDEVHQMVESQRIP